MRPQSLYSVQVSLCTVVIDPESLQDLPLSLFFIVVLQLSYVLKGIISSQAQAGIFTSRPHTKHGTILLHIHQRAIRVTLPNMIHQSAISSLSPSSKMVSLYDSILFVGNASWSAKWCATIIESLRIRMGPNPELLLYLSSLNADKTDNVC